MEKRLLDGGLGTALGWLLNKPKEEEEEEEERPYLEGPFEIEQDDDYNWDVLHDGKLVGVLSGTDEDGWGALRFRPGHSARESPIFDTRKKAIAWLRGA